MVNWEQVINEMELPALLDPSRPSVFIEQADGSFVNLRDLGVRVTGFSIEMKMGTNLADYWRQRFIDNDMLGS